MKIDKTSRDGVAILKPYGKITIGAGDVALREAVVETLEGGEKSIILDLSQVTTVDSSGIGEMVSGFTSVSNRKGALKLLNLPPKVTDILQITQLITVFEVYDDEDEAVASFLPASGGSR